MNQRAAFDPGDDFDAMAESFRIHVTRMILEARSAAVFRDLPPTRQIECFMAGVATGLVGVCLTCVEEQGWDEMMEFISNYLPLARQNAEEIIREARP